MLFDGISWNIQNRQFHRERKRIDCIGREGIGKEEGIGREGNWE